MSDVDLNDVAVFAAVVQHGGFTAAAKVLGLPTSAVSRRIARLESSTGFKLLHRTTRKVSVTEAGRIFHERTAQLSSTVHEALRTMSSLQTAPGGRLKIAAPPDDDGVIWALITGFAHDYPDVDLEIVHTLDRVDLMAEGVDVALRGGPPPDSTVFTAVQIFESRLLLAASPDYLDHRGVPERVEDLAEHDGICMDPWAPNAIRRLNGDTRPVRLNMRNRIRANSLETARRAALDGLGIAPLLHLTCAQHLRRGELVEILRGALPDRAAMWALSPLGRVRSAAADALIRHLKATAPGLRAQAGPD